jgi:glycosyltransferase involved in cell wall biosynthesis
MKIAIMMRPMDQPTGRRFCMEGLVRKLLDIDDMNSYLLLYMKPNLYGLFSGFKNVKEVLIQSSNKFIWDQIVVPYIAWRERADIIYNPKFSVPLISHCPVAMGLQEPVWWMFPEHHTWLDVRYQRILLPIYIRKAAYLFPASNFILNENRKCLDLPLENASVAYNAPTGNFRSISDFSALREFREKHGLPEKFILTVSRVENRGNSKTSFCPTKNIETTINAYRITRGKIPHQLVIAGQNIREYLLHTGWPESELEGVHFLGFVPHNDMPLLYNSAEMFLIPSFYEGCPNTLIEGMSCGTPIIASKTGPCPEISGGAALLADPYNPSEFAERILTVARNKELRKDLSDKALKRASFFTWNVSARIILDGLTQAAQRIREHKGRHEKPGPSVTSGETCT